MSHNNLRRFCQNVPLPQLVQGSFLTIRSTTISSSSGSDINSFLLQQQQQQQHFQQSQSQLYQQQLYQQQHSLIEKSTTKTTSSSSVSSSVSSSSSSESVVSSYYIRNPTTVIPIHVIIEPSWRDHGHVELRQYFRTTTATTSNTSTTTTNSINHHNPYHNNNNNNNTTTTLSLNKIQMTVNTNHPLQSSKDRDTVMVPHITIDLTFPNKKNHQHEFTTLPIVEQQPEQDAIISTMTNDSTTTATPTPTEAFTTSTTHSGLSEKTTPLLSHELNEMSPMWIEEVVDNDDHHEVVNETTITSVGNLSSSSSSSSTSSFVSSSSSNDNTTTTSTNYHHNPNTGSHSHSNDNYFNNNNNTSYVVLTIQVPEKLNLTCELLHHHHHHHHHDDNNNNNNVIDNNNNNNTKDTSNHQNDDHPKMDLIHNNNNDIQPSILDHLEPKSSITIRSKIEGDIILQNSNGNIMVTKLRGHDITLQTTNGIIYASQLLEAQRLTMQCSNSSRNSSIRTNEGGDGNNSSNTRIRAKQIHASHVDITVDQRHQQSDAITILDNDDDEGSLVDISSMFISGSNGGAIIAVHGPECNNDKVGDTPMLASQQQPQRRAVRIKSHHGPVQVTTTQIGKPMELNPMTEQYYPIVELGGVNGSCEVSIINDNNKTKSSPIVDNNDEWSSCMVHIDSLATDSVSLVTANTGNIDITVDRKAEADLRLASLSTAESINEVGALLAEEDNNNHIVSILKNLHGTNDGSSTTEIETDPLHKSERISIHTAAFTNRFENGFSNSNVSYVDGWVENKSSEPDSRFERKNQGVGKIRLDGAHTQALNSFGGGSSKDDTNPENNDKNTLRPLLAVVGTNEIRVETVSWLGAIARRYGLEESGRELGRTASRKGRTLNEPGTAVN